MQKTVTAAILAATTALTAVPAMAGSADLAKPEPALTPAQPFTPSGADWTRFYVGGQLGYAGVDVRGPGGGDDGFIGGLTAGYDYDFGQWVLGAGIDYDFTDVSLNAPGVSADLDGIFRLKARGGYKIGNGLLYGTGGYAVADTSGFGSEDGYFVGGGYEHFVTDQITIGTEVLYHEFNNVGSTQTDLDTTTVQVRATFRF